MNITDFLLARIAEDEAAARAAAPWATGSRHEGQPLDWSIHFDRWSPARVQAECALKRAIIVAHRQQEDDDDPGAWIVASEVLLTTLAAVYKDHPDYRQDWA